jgi:hypothetical protein
MWVSGQFWKVMVCGSVLAIKTLAFEPIGTGLFVVLIVSTRVFIIGIKIVAMVMVAVIGVPSMFVMECALMLMR